MRRARIARPPAEARHEATLARLRITESGLAWLEQIAADAAAPDDVIDRLHRSLQARSRTLGNEDGSPGLGGDAGRDATRLQVQRQLDLEEAGLSDT